MWYNVIMLRKIIISLSVIALVVILFFVNFTTPTEIGPFGVLIFFLAVYLFILGLSLVLISLLRAILKGVFFVALVFKILEYYLYTPVSQTSGRLKSTSLK